MLFEYSLARNDILIPATRASRQFVCASILQDLVLMLTVNDFTSLTTFPFSRYNDAVNSSYLGNDDYGPMSNTIFSKYTNISNLINTNISVTDCSSGMMLICTTEGTSRRGYLYVQVAIVSATGPAQIEVTMSLLSTPTKPLTLPPSRTATIKIINDNGSYIITNNAIILSMSTSHLMLCCKNYITYNDPNEGPITGAYYQSGCVIGAYKISNFWKTDYRVTNKLNYIFIKLGFKVPTNVDPIGQSLEVFDPVAKAIATVDVNPMYNNFIWRAHINLNVATIVSTPDMISDGARNKSDWMYPLRLISLRSTEYIHLELSKLLFASGQIGYAGDVVIDDTRKQYSVFPVNSTAGQPILYSADSNTAAYPKILLPMY